MSCPEVSSPVFFLAGTLSYCSTSWMLLLYLPICKASEDMYMEKNIVLCIFSGDWSHMTELCYDRELEFIAWSVAGKTIFQLILR